MWNETCIILVLTFHTSHISGHRSKLKVALAFSKTAVFWHIGFTYISQLHRFWQYMGYFLRWQSWSWLDSSRHISSAATPDLRQRLVYTRDTSTCYLSLRQTYLLLSNSLPLQTHTECYERNNKSVSKVHACSRLKIIDYGVSYSDIKKYCQFLANKDQVELDLLIH